MQSHGAIIFVLGAIFALGVALLCAVNILHSNTEAWFIGGMFSYVLSVVLASHALGASRPPA
jgi:uncharacterized membrane protein YadS